MATQLSNAVEIFSGDIFTTSVGVQQHTLGSVGFTADGRKFRYVGVFSSAGNPTNQTAGATLVSGNVIQSPANVPNHLALVPSAATLVGDTTITLTLGNTATWANQYAGGYMMISTGPGNGIAYLIKSHPAAAALATVVLTLSDSIKVITSTASRMDLQMNAFNGVIQSPITTTTGAILGVAVNPIAAATDGTVNYGWIQTYGPCAALNTGSTTLGSGLAAANPGAAGSVYTMVNTNAFTMQMVGYALGTGVTGKNNAIFLTID